LRRDRGLTLRRLAQEVGLDFTYLSKIENGSDVPGEETLRRMEGFFGTEPEELVVLAGKVPPELTELARQDASMGRLLRRLHELPADKLQTIYREAGVDTAEDVT